MYHKKEQYFSPKDQAEQKVKSLTAAIETNELQKEQLKDYVSREQLYVWNKRLKNLRSQLVEWKVKLKQLS